MFTKERLTQLSKDWEELENQATDLVYKIRPDLKSWDSFRISEIDPYKEIVEVSFTDWKCGSHDYDAVNIPFYAFENNELWLENLEAERIVKLEAKKEEQRLAQEKAEMKNREKRLREYQKLKAEFELKEG